MQINILLDNETQEVGIFLQDTLLKTSTKGYKMSFLQSTCRRKLQ